jgi:hypothetical protein
MKSPSQTQSTSTHPPDLSELNSILQALSSSNVELPVFPITTSPESEEAIQQHNRRLRMEILDSAIALLDSYDF